MRTVNPAQSSAHIRTEDLQLRNTLWAAAVRLCWLNMWLCTSMLLSASPRWCAGDQSLLYETDSVVETNERYGPDPAFDSIGWDEGVDDPACAECVSEQAYPIAGFGAFSAGPDWDDVVRRMRFHHSSTDGRTYGSHQAMRGTSWLNRPYYVGISSGGFFMTQGVQDNVRNDNDLFAALQIGWDWDYFWALEFRLGRAQPEMVNKVQPTVARNDALLITDLSLVYYPAGDTVVRPYLRVGVGWTDFDFPTDTGARVEVSPFTMPFGLGIKWPVRRWLAARVELLDNLAFADSAVNTHHNFTLVLGLEYRLGAKPKSYWPWHPNRHIW